MRSLQHLDLSDCGLTEQIVLDIVNVLNQNTGLVAIHLSGNPGIKDHIIEQIQE